MIRSLPRLPVCLLALSAVLLSSAATAPAEEPATVVEFRLTRDVQGAASAKDALAATRVWSEVFADALAERGRPVKIRVALEADLDLLADQLATGAVKSAYVSALQYVRLRERVEVVPVSTLINLSGGTTLRSVLVARNATGAESIHDLRGKRFAYLGSTSSVGRLYPEWLLEKAGLPELASFFDLHDAKSERAALYSVIMGQADATAISLHTLATVVEMTPPAAKRVRRIATSGPMPFGVLIAGPHLERSVFDEFVSFVAVQESVTDPRLDAALQVLKVGGMRRVVDADFAFVREMIADVDERVPRHVDPICGALLSDATAHSTEPLGGETLRFCSDPCIQEYRRHLVRDFPGEEGTIVLSLTPNWGVDRDPRDVIEATKVQFKRVADEMGVAVALELLPSLSAARERFRNGTLDLARVTGREYVLLRDSVAVEPLVRHTGSTEQFQVVLITSSTSGVRDAAGLRGKRLALSAAGKNESELFLRQVVRGLGGAQPADYFDEIIRCRSDVAAINAVAVGSADAALVPSNTLDVFSEMRPAIAAELRRLDASQSFNQGPLVHRADMDPAIVATLRDNLLRLHEVAEGRAALEMFGIRRLVVATNSDYDGVRQLLEGVR